MNPNPATTEKTTSPPPQNNTLDAIETDNIFACSSEIVEQIVVSLILSFYRDTTDDDVLRIFRRDPSIPIRGRPAEIIQRRRMPVSVSLSMNSIMQLRLVNRRVNNIVVSLFSDLCRGIITSTTAPLVRCLSTASTSNSSLFSRISILETLFHGHRAPRGHEASQYAPMTMREVLTRPLTKFVYRLLGTLSETRVYANVRYAAVERTTVFKGADVSSACFMKGHFTRTVHVQYTRTVVLRQDYTPRSPLVEGGTTPFRCGENAAEFRIEHATEVRAANIGRTRVHIRGHTRGTAVGRSWAWNAVQTQYSVAPGATLVLEPPENGRVIHTDENMRGIQIRNIGPRAEDALQDAATVVRINHFISDVIIERMTGRATSFDPMPLGIEFGPNGRIVDLWLHPLIVPMPFDMQYIQTCVDHAAAVTLILPQSEHMVMETVAFNEQTQGVRILEDTAPTFGAGNEARHIDRVRALIAAMLPDDVLRTLSPGAHIVFEDVGPDIDTVARLRARGLVVEYDMRMPNTEAQAAIRQYYIDNGFPLH